MDGFLVIDKPEGISSHGVVNAVRKLIGEKRAGHTGTLDPFATGVLPVAVGEATKAIPYLDEGVKEYRAVMRLGIATDTQDKTGRIISESDLLPADQEIADAVDSFAGSGFQIPPMFSALKRNGVPLYKLARQGAELQREPRPIRIFSIAIEGISGPLVAFTVTCSRGTYVRTLASDIGTKLGCGAHLVELRRTKSGPFDLSQAISLDDLAHAVEKKGVAGRLMPLHEALAHISYLELTDNGARRVSHGMLPQMEDLKTEVPPVIGALVRMGRGGELMAIAEVISHPVGFRFLRVFNV